MFRQSTFIVATLCALFIAGCDSAPTHDSIAKETVTTIEDAAAILATVIGWAYVHRLEDSFVEGGETVPVLVAAKYLPRGSALKPAHFQTASVPRVYIQPGAVSSFDVLLTSGNPRFRAGVSMDVW